MHLLFAFAKLVSVAKGRLIQTNRIVIFGCLWIFPGLLRFVSQIIAVVAEIELEVELTDISYAFCWLFDQMLDIISISSVFKVHIGEFGHTLPTISPFI